MFGLAAAAAAGRGPGGGPAAPAAGTRVFLPAIHLTPPPGITLTHTRQPFHQEDSSK